MQGRVISLGHIAVCGPRTFIYCLPEKRHNERGVCSRNRLCRAVREHYIQRKKKEVSYDN